MEMPHTEPEAIKPRPDYPPKTPPPPKRPSSPPPPDALRSDLLRGLPVPRRSGRAGVPVMKNRRGSSWTLDAEPWVPAKAARHVAERLTAWGCKAPALLEDVVSFLVTSIITDGSRRISVHVSEQNHHVLILALSHQAPDVALAEDVLPTLRDLGAVSCGTENSSEGRQVWALLDLAS